MTWLEIILFAWGALSMIAIGVFVLFIVVLLCLPNVLALAAELKK